MKTGAFDFRPVLNSNFIEEEQNMELKNQIAAHLHSVFFGGNWTSVNFQEVIRDVSWQQAITRVGNLNTIGMLVYHIDYYVKAALKVLQGGTLQGIHDKFSFDLPAFQNEEAWQEFIAGVLDNAKTCTNEIRNMDESLLFRDFTESKYGSYYWNLQGLIEHTHYHLGQIVIIKKLVSKND